MAKVMIMGWARKKATPNSVEYADHGRGGQGYKSGESAALVASK